MLRDVDRVSSVVHSHLIKHNFGRSQKSFDGISFA